MEDQADFYLCKPGGEAVGPYAIDQIRSMWSAGGITSDTLYSAGAGENWKPLRPFLFPPVEPPAIIDPLVCESCGGATSPREASCAHCGHFKPGRTPIRPQNQRMAGLLVAIAIGLVLGGIVFFYIHRATVQKRQEIEERQQFDRTQESVAHTLDRQ